MVISDIVKLFFSHCDFSILRTLLHCICLTGIFGVGRWFKLGCKKVAEKG